MVKSIGFTSGIAFVALGFLSFIYSMFVNMLIEPETAIHEITQQTVITHKLLSLLIIGIGVIIMEMKKIKE